MAVSAPVGANLSTLVIASLGSAAGGCQLFQPFPDWPYPSWCMPGILLDLTRVADRTGYLLQSPPVAAGPLVLRLDERRRACGRAPLAGHWSGYTWCSLHR
ncbi:MAG: hypothetical protein E7A88_00460 [Dermabacter sp.]|nr:hypothetical protein [Dermabacter sp.]MDU2597341.1 hypothetical protein [Dermabacter sp.]